MHAKETCHLFLTGPILPGYTTGYDREKHVVTISFAAAVTIAMVTMAIVTVSIVTVGFEYLTTLEA